MSAPRDDLRVELAATDLDDGAPSSEDRPAREDLPVVRTGLDLDRLVLETLDHLPNVGNLYRRNGGLCRIAPRELDPRQRMLDAARAGHFPSTKERRLIIARTADVLAYFEVRLRTTAAPVANDADPEAAALARVSMRRVRK